MPEHPKAVNETSNEKANETSDGSANETSDEKTNETSNEKSNETSDEKTNETYHEKSNETSVEKDESRLDMGGVAPWRLQAAAKLFNQVIKIMEKDFSSTPCYTFVTTKGLLDVYRPMLA